MTAADAIRQSIAQTEIVTIGSAGNALSYADAEPIMSELSLECEDSADDDPKGGCAEYWGTDSAGQEWRVHVWFDSPADHTHFSR